MTFLILIKSIILFYLLNQNKNSTKGVLYLLYYSDIFSDTFSLIQISIEIIDSESFSVS